MIAFVCLLSWKIGPQLGGWRGPRRIETPNRAARYRVRNAKPYKVSDLQGLYLLAYPRGRKLWRVNYRINYRINGVERKLAWAAR